MPRTPAAGRYWLPRPQTEAALGDREAPREDGGRSGPGAGTGVPLTCPSASCTGCQAGGKDHLDIRAAVPQGEGPSPFQGSLSPALGPPPPWGLTMGLMGVGADPTLLSHPGWAEGGLLAPERGEGRRAWRGLGSMAAAQQPHFCAAPGPGRGWALPLGGLLPQSPAAGESRAQAFQRACHPCRHLQPLPGGSHVSRPALG